VWIIEINHLHLYSAFNNVDCSKAAKTVISNKEFLIFWGTILLMNSDQSVLCQISVKNE